MDFVLLCDIINIVIFIYIVTKKGGNIIMKWLKRIILVILVIILVVIGIVLANGYGLYRDVIKEESIEDKVEKIRNDEDFVALSSLPEKYKQAVIAVEDHRYEEHGAIDLIAIGRAIWVNVSNFELREGGSTITQQVAKNMYFIENEENPVKRKIAEIFVAFDLESKYSKDDILELYVNTIYFGDGYYGIKEACNGYLDKEPQDMNLYEATMMAGIPNAPSVYAPTVNPELTKSRQQKVIDSMVEYGYLTQEEADSIHE